MKERNHKDDTTVKEFKKSFKYMLFVLAAASVLSLFFIAVAKDALSLGKASHSADVVIESGMGVTKIASELKKSEIIRYPWAFTTFAVLTRNSSKFRTGTFTLNSEMDYLWICSLLKSKAAAKQTVRVTIPEGKELREIFEKLEESGVCKADELYKAMDQTTFKYDFIKKLPKRENRLEGYLFPDTYEFYKNDDPAKVLDKMLSNFDLKFDEEMAAKAKAMNMSVDQVVTLASIVEREAANDEDRGNVASVFLNRLKASSQYPYLQSCATVQYVLKERKAVLSIADTKIDSPYNTYRVKGLPAGPIASPGKASIEAVLGAPQTDYYFFVLGKNGEHIFSKTLEEHTAAIKNAKNSSGTGTVAD